MPPYWPRLLSLNRLSLRANSYLRVRQQTRLYSNHIISGTNASSQIISYNRKITQLIRSGRFEDARDLFDRLPQRNTVTWNSMLSGYVKRREIAKARRFFDHIPEKDIVSWNLMVSAYVSCRSRRHLDEGRRLFDEMPERDCVSWNTVISGYARNGFMDDAWKLFEAMPKKNVVSWNAMVGGFFDNGDVRRGYELFKRMPKRDGASLSVLLSGLIRNYALDLAENVLLEFGNVGEGNEDLVRAYNTLMAGYGQKGRVEDARRLFDRIPSRSSVEGGANTGFERNVVSWNSMIMAYVKAKDMESAKKLFNDMEEKDTVTWNTMISGYAQASDMESAVELFTEMSNDPDSQSWNSIISGFAQAGNMELALEFFDKMPEKNLVSWNTMIAGYEKIAEYEEGIKLFLEMQAEGEKPDRHTLSSLLSICAETTDHHLGMQIHQLVAKRVVPDVPLNNALITMYASCGEISKAEIIFEEVRLHKEVISWNAMIGGYASHGYATEALELFESMKRANISPTYITFISVLSACARSGLVSQGRLYFRSMTRDFGIEPRTEHYASLVDVVGRCGRVYEALDIVRNMTIEPDKAVWGALLAACRVHNGVEVARVAAQALMRLEPESSGPYVLLYNMYADSQRWNDADEIRAMMDKNNIRKEKGYSRGGF